MSRGVEIVASEVVSFTFTPSPPIHSVQAAGVADAIKEERAVLAARRVRDGLDGLDHCLTRRFLVIVPG